VRNRLSWDNLQKELNQLLELRNDLKRQFRISIVRELPNSEGLKMHHSPSWSMVPDFQSGQIKSDRRFESDMML
jgi:hypothetical protein